MLLFLSKAGYFGGILKWILNRNIDVAFVDLKWMTASFNFESNVEKMLKKGINPFVVRYDGESEFVSKQANFKKIDRKLLETFLTGKKAEEKTEAFYSFQDSECGDTCENSCKDKMLKFKLYTGERNFESEKRGGQGIVSFGTWHGETAAFKLLKLEKIEPHFKTSISDGISDAEKTRAEFETVSKLSHPNILRVLHVFRYQKKTKNVKVLHFCRIGLSS